MRHTIKIPTETLRRLRIIAAHTGETYAALLGRLIGQEFQTVRIWAEEVIHEPLQEVGSR